MASPPHLPVLQLSDSVESSTCHPDLQHFKKQITLCMGQMLLTGHAEHLNIYGVGWEVKG